jgi:hypothetical protein
LILEPDSPLEREHVAHQISSELWMKGDEREKLNDALGDAAVDLIVKASAALGVVPPPAID